MKRVSVVFISDENYIVHLSVALISLLVNNKKLKMNIYIIGNGIKEKNFYRLKKMCDSYDVNLKQFIVNDKIFDKFITTYHFTKAIYYRLLIPHFIEDNKVLYLDSDVIVNDSIEKLFEINLTNNYIAGVINPGFNRQKEFMMNLNAKYFNSGVMLINNYLWKKDDIPKQCIELIEKYSDILMFPDQDALNAVINGRWIPLPLKYNVQSVFFEDNCYEKYPELDYFELQDAIKNPIIIHYTGSSKPWQVCNKHPYKNLYWKYLKLTYFKRRLPEINYMNIIKCIVPDNIYKLIKKSLKTDRN